MRPGKGPVAVLLLLSYAVLVGCATTEQLPPPRSLRRPEPRLDNQGAFLSPYRKDLSCAVWVGDLKKAKVFKSVGSASGAAAAVAATTLGFWSLILGSIGSALGRQAAIQAAGGWEKIRESSDVSFDKVDDLVVYLYEYFSAEESYADALTAVGILYPEVKDRYIPAIVGAKKARRS